MVGLAAGVVCSWAIGLKHSFNYDDSLDVVGVHFTGGIVGTLLIGLLAAETMTGGPEGLLIGRRAGPVRQAGRRDRGGRRYAFVVSYVLGTVVNKVVGFRLAPQAEQIRVAVALDPLGHELADDRLAGGPHDERFFELLAAGVGDHGQLGAEPVDVLGFAV